MTNAIEVMARAIFEDHNKTYDASSPCRWESDPDHWRRYAKSALRALASLPPSEGMVEAGADAMVDTQIYLSRDEFEELARACITAAFAQLGREGDNG